MMRSSLSAVAIAAVFLAQGAGATCTQANLAGKWNSYAVAAAKGGSLDWISCSLDIGAKGKFIGATSSCMNSANVASKASGEITLHTADKCIFTGTITFPGYKEKDTIRSITLSSEKSTASGIGGGTGLGGVFVFNMVKTS